MCDLVYTLLVDKADKLDRVYLHAQLVSGKEIDDIKMTPYRDDLDSTLLSPVGEDAENEQALLRYLKGE